MLRLQGSNGEKATIGKKIVGQSPRARCFSMSPSKDGIQERVSYSITNNSMCDNYWEDPQLAQDESIKIFLTTKELDLAEGVKFVKTSKAGAVISFCGTTRDVFEGKQVSDLGYESHHRLALKTLGKIVQECKTKFENSGKDEKIHRVYVGHRLGKVPIMEDSIIVCLSSTHRQEGWNAGIWLLDTIKERVEIWKTERYIDGGFSWKENDNANVTDRV